jgi:hypothetical protein
VGNAISIKKSPGWSVTRSEGGEDREVSMTGGAQAFFTTLALKRSSCVLIAVAGSLLTTPLRAQTCGPLGCIEEIFTLNFLDYREPDATVGFVNRQSIDIGADFVPNPPGPSISFLNEQAFAAQTTVTATQNNQTYPLFYINSPALPNYWSTLVPVTTGLAGQWTLSVANPKYGTLEVSTAPIPTGTPVLPFINNAQISSLTPTATVSWVQPSFQAPAGDTFGATIGAHNISTNTLIDLYNINNIAPGTLYSYSLSNFKTVPLTAGGNYAIEVDSALFSNNGAILSTSRNYFNFKLQTGGADPAGVARFSFL